MKKLLLSGVLLLLGIGMACAEEKYTEETYPYPLPVSENQPLQIGLFPHFPSAQLTSNVFGLKTGWPITWGHGRTYGLEMSWVVTGITDMRGVQASWIYCSNLFGRGLQAGLVCRSTETYRGLQSGLAYASSGEMKGVQLSALTIADAFSGVQAGVAGAFADDFTGVQLSVIISMADKMSGIQAAIYNQADSIEGAQIGIVNVLKGPGMQFGLINYNKDALIPIFPFFNVSF